MKQESFGGRNLSFASRNLARNRNNPFYTWHKSRLKERNEAILNEIEAQKSIEYGLEDFSKLKNTLNPVIWNEDNTLKKDIREDLLEVAKRFFEYLNVDTKIEDVILVGSSANYNYTKHSDIDLHIIMDLSKLDGSEEMKREFLDIKRLYWNMMHDITIKDYEVEVYVQDINDKVDSGGIFSLKKNKWIVEPDKSEEKIDVDFDLVKKKVDTIIGQIDDLENIDNDQKREEVANTLKEKIKTIRQDALESKGEFSEGNIVFKILRNTGYIDKLFNTINTSMDKKLTIKESGKNIALDEKAVSEKQRNFFGLVRALQKGEIKPSKLSKNIQKVAKNMDPQDVKDFASTKDSEIKKESDEGHKYEYGCLMCGFDLPIWNTKVLGKIKREDVYNEPGFGLEYDPHCTVLFGFHVEDTNVDDVIKEVNDYVVKPIKVSVKGISCFQSQDYDVLKFDVESPYLVELNEIMKEKFNHTQSFPKYQPHITIAYLKKGAGKKYERTFDKDIILTSDDFVYSSPDKTKVYWNPENKEIKKVVEFQANNGKNHISVVKSDIKSDKLNYIIDFVGFVCDNLCMEKPISLFLRNGRDEYVKSTASYVPSENTNHINIKNRALVDICRSIAHELSHNRQREIGKIVDGVEVPNIGYEIENEADSVAGMLIKHYTHTNGVDEIYDI